MVWANDFYYELIGYPKEEYEALFHNRPDLYYAEDQEHWTQLGAAVTKALVIQKQMEQSVAYDNLPGFVGKFRVDRELQFYLLEANERFVQFFGEGCWDNSSALFRRNVERNAQAFEANRAQMQAGEPVHFTTHMQDQFGSEAWLQINAACVDWQGGDPVYLAIYIDVTNVTELRQMQKKLEEQAEDLKRALELAEQANRAKSDFLSHMSHDIRTPMNANDVLDMSRIESGKMTINEGSLLLPELLENVVAIMQPHIKAKNQQFAVHVRHVCHEQFRSDALRLRQIFLNILSNASKFTPVEGRITVSVEELPADDASTALLRFRFSDSGIGMNQAFVEHIFEPFSREKDSRVDKTEGSGLGMAITITKKLVDLLGGEITVESQVGMGTTFQINPPLPIEEKPPQRPDFNHLSIIVVDDDADMCEYMAQTLEGMGVRVDICHTVEEAVAKIARASRAGAAYDAAFLDWKMPDMDGPQTARAIRDRVGRTLPILIVSAYDWSDIEEEAMGAGVDGFISKPLFVSTLCRALRQYVFGEQTSEEAVQKQAEARALEGRHVLLVEDNELNREIAAELLSDMGAQVSCARDGAEGVELFACSSEGWYELVLMDVQMPVLNGYEATRRIRGLRRRDAGTVPILAMTADAFAEDIARAREAGMNGHLAKPLDVVTLRREILRTLRGAQSAPK